MQVIADTSIWVAYFRGGNRSNDLDILIDENLVATNDLILSELIPFLKIKKKPKVIRLLHDLTKISLEIDWEGIVYFQTSCLQLGRNGIGIPDLIIAQNCIQNDCLIYSLDKHFTWLQDIIGIKVYQR